MYGKKKTMAGKSKKTKTLTTAQKTLPKFLQKKIIKSKKKKAEPFIKSIQKISIIHIRP